MKRASEEPAPGDKEAKRAAVEDGVTPGPVAAQPAPPGDAAAAVAVAPAGVAPTAPAAATATPAVADGVAAAAPSGSTGAVPMPPSGGPQTSESTAGGAVTGDKAVAPQAPAAPASSGAAAPAVAPNSGDSAPAPPGTAAAEPSGPAQPDNDAAPAAPGSGAATPAPPAAAATVPGSGIAGPQAAASDATGAGGGVAAASSEGGVAALAPSAEKDAMASATAAGKAAATAMANVANAAANAAASPTTSTTPAGAGGGAESEAGPDGNNSAHKANNGADAGPSPVAGTPGATTTASATLANAAGGAAPNAVKAEAAKGPQAAAAPNVGAASGMLNAAGQHASISALSSKILQGTGGAGAGGVGLGLGPGSAGAAAGAGSLGGLMVQTQQAGQAQAQPGRQLGVEDALAYLDKVKRQFSDRLEVYNQFLEIMKNFKSHNIDTPGVINHVCELFKGHNNLILGFNTFLPPGFKIELPNHAVGPMVAGRPIVTQSILTTQQQQQLFQHQAAAAAAAAQQGGPAQRKGGRGRGRGGGGKGGLGAGGRLLGPGAGVGMMDDGGALPMQVGGGLPMVEDTVATATTQGQPVEFDHAINYVTKIKKRFSSKTETYKTFLDILHSYQNEQRSIKQVLEQVSNLFKDHADLLKEFTYFLPDAVRETAKSELVKRAAKAQKASARARAKAQKGGKKSLPMSENDAEETRIPQLERNLLGRVKAALGTRELWGEFLKCLDLFAQEIISRAELLALISDIFGERVDLLEEFDRLLASRGATEDPVESAWFSMPLTDIDFANCRRCTPSYRALPAAFPKAPCSERTAMCRSVLNDTWVSVPLGSEDSSSMNHRRNQYEEALFKCEDDRYEVDMIIDSNKAAIRALEPLAREIESLQLANSQSAKFRYRLEKRTLSVIHLKAIARIYGDHGTEILELLRRNPAAAIPIILRRLKEKDAEWCKERLRLNKTWKSVMERNYLKSLDHRSFYFKQTEKRAFSHKTLITELKEKRAKAGAEAAANGKPETVASPDADPAEDHLCLPFEDPSLHRFVWGLIALKLERTCERREVERIAALYAYVLHPLFLLPDTWLHPSKPLLQSVGSNEGFGGVADPKGSEDSLPKGSAVRTPYGVGAVERYDVDSSMGFYTIKLPYGVAHLRPALVKPHSADNPLLAALANPLPMSDASAESSQTKGAESKVHNLFTTAQGFVFLRQYHLLYSRILRAKHLCEANAKPRPVVQQAEGTAGGMQVDEGAGKTEEDEETTAAAKFTTLLSLVYSLLNGALDAARFEDECRNLVGPDVYFLFTVDKLVAAIQKQLSSLVSDEKSSDTVQAIAAYRAEPSPEALAKVYRANAVHLMQTEGAGVRVRFFPGTPRTQAEREAEAQEEGPLPVPSSSIVKPRRKIVSRWKQAPRLAFSLVESLPMVEPPAADATKEAFAAAKVPAVAPLCLDFGPVLEAGRALDLGADNASLPPRAGGSAEAGAAGKQEDGQVAETRLTLPFYNVVRLPGTKEVFESVKAYFAPSAPADGAAAPDAAAAAAAEAARKAKADPWYLAVLANDEATKPGNPPAVPNGEDVEMKTD